MVETRSVRYTVESDEGVYRSCFPSEGELNVAHLFDDYSDALRYVDNPQVWRVSPITNIEEWLEAQFAAGIQSVITHGDSWRSTTGVPGWYSVVDGTPDWVNGVEFWLNSCRSTRRAQEGEGQIRK